MEECGWQKWPTSPSAVLLITASRPDEKDAEGTTHALYFYAGAQDTDSDAWARGAAQFAATQHGLLRRAITGLRPRLVVVETAMLARVGGVFGAVESRPAFTVLDTTAEERVGAKVKTVKVWFLVVPLKNFQRARHGWLAPCTYPAFAKDPGERVHLLYPGTREAYDVHTVSFGAPTANAAVNAARARTFDAVWTTGIHAKLPQEGGKALVPATYFGEPYYMYKEERAVGVAPWVNALAALGAAPKRVLVVGHPFFCARFAAYVRSRHDPVAAPEVPCGPAWQPFLSDDARRVILTEIDGNRLFPVLGGQLGNEKPFIWAAPRRSAPFRARCGRSRTRTTGRRRPARRSSRTCALPSRR